MSDNRMTVTDVLSRLRLVSDGLNGYYAACPVHEDRTPSLTVAEGRDGRVLVFCHVCSLRMGKDAFVAEFFRVITGAAVSPEARRRMADYQRKPRRDERQWRVVRTHRYLDDRGCAVVKKDRMDVVDTATGEVTKAFVWRHNETPDAEYARWMPGLNGHDPGLYRAWELTDGDVAWLVEGERDADALTERDLVAVSPPHGAGSALTGTDIALLRRASEVRVVADDDEAGRAHGNAVARQLRDVGASVSLWLPPEGHNDVTDALDAGLDLETFRPIEIEGVVDDLGARRRLRVTRASKIVPRAVRWLWQDLVPLGELTLTAGREGVGKSAVVLDVGSMTTQGQLDGDLEGQSRAVLVAATEDSWEHTIVPRLIAAGADLDRVLRVDVVDVDGFDGDLSLPGDLSELAEIVSEEDVALVIVDPLMSRIGANLDTHKDAEVRRALEPLKRFADSTGVAVVGLIHLNKGQDADPLNRVMGSKAFTAVARSVLLVAEDTADETGQRRLLGQIKSNLGPVSASTEAFTLEPKPVGDRIEAPRVVWHDPVDRPIARLLGDSDPPGVENRTAVDSAVSWLCDYLLEHGATHSETVKDHAERAGIHVSTLQRATKVVGVVVDNTRTTPRRTVWSLPDASTTGE